MELKSLEDVMHYVCANYVYDAKNYPSLEGLAADRRAAFAINHSTSHMMKSIGRIAAQNEAVDHGGSLDMEALKEATVKMLINTMKLAGELGMSAEDLCRAVPQFMKHK